MLALNEDDVMTCNGCLLNGTSPKVPDMGSRKSGIMVVGEAPHTTEVSIGKPFVGRSGELLTKMLQLININRDDIVIANAIKCLLPDKNRIEAEVKKIADNCRPFLIRTITKAKPRLIIALGATALRTLMGNKYSNISRHSGKFFKSEPFNCTIFATYHPSFILRQAHKGYPDIPTENMGWYERTYIQNFKRIAQFLNDDKLDVSDVFSFSRINPEYLKKMMNRPIVAFDIEWNSKTGEPICISFSSGINMGKVYFFNGRNEELAQLMANPAVSKIVANRPVDENKLKEIGIEVRGKVHDVFLLAHLLDENIPNISLENLANTYLDSRFMDIKKDIDRDNLSEIPKKELIQYAGRDALVTYNLYEIFKKKLSSDTPLMRYYGRFIMPVSDMFTDISTQRYRIDVKKLKENDASLERQANEIAESLLSEIPEKIKAKYKDLSIGKKGLLIDYLFSKNGLGLKPEKFTPKTKQPTLDEAHLKMFPIDWVRKYLELGKINKIRSTYIQPLYEMLDSNGTISIQTFLYRTVTGRVVSKPAIQTIPQRGKYAKYVKELYIPDEGWLMGARDLSQSEVRIMAWLANEQTMLNVFREDGDIHRETASLIIGKPVGEITKEERQKAKAFVFGFLYGMQASSFVEYAKDEYGMEFSLEEAEDARNAFFKAYPNILLYHKKIEGLVKRKGVISSPLGRKRRFPEISSPDIKLVNSAIRKAINFPIQSFSSDLGLLGMYLFWEDINKDKKLKGKVKIMWFIHDAIFFQAREDIMDYAMQKLKSALEVKTYDYIRKNFGINIGYTIKSDGKIGKSWQELEGLKEEK